MKGCRHSHQEGLAEVAWALLKADDPYPPRVRPLRLLIRANRSLLRAAKALVGAGKGCEVEKDQATFVGPSRDNNRRGLGSARE
ncbi:hypothetical protein NL676_007387 [Syzygium grande]|nr:hypothetical protein NL676_007387 [Syzygium grande]